MSKSIARWFAAAAVVVAAGIGLQACGQPPGPAGFEGPTAVCHDSEGGFYLVANRNGDAGAKDGNGFISRMVPGAEDAAGTQWRWITGARDGVTLHAPAGIVVHEATLFVTDIDVVRRFDRESGTPQEELVVAGASRLGAVAVAPDGTVYVAGRGVRDGAIWRLAPGSSSFEELVSGPDLGLPVGLVARPAALYVVNAAGAFFQIDGQGRRTALGQVPTGGVTGLARANGAYCIPSAAGQCVYRFAATGGVEALSQRVPDPGNCAFDTSRGVLVVPSLSGNLVGSVAVPAR
ncbi:MAG: hypothetical protein NXI31_03940 [bacterium]|nr:hypothetical protein [bacterium]